MKHKLNTLFKKELDKFDFNHVLIKPSKRGKNEYMFDYPLISFEHISYGGSSGEAFILKQPNDVKYGFWTKLDETIVRIKMKSEVFKDKEDIEISLYFNRLIDCVYNGFKQKVNPDNEDMFGDYFGFEYPGSDGYMRSMSDGSYEVRLYSNMITRSQLYKAF